MQQPERLLIVNADDLGLSPAVSRGILELARLGAVTSASLMANMPGASDALAAAHAADLDLGVHLNLCTGTPLLPAHTVPSLLGTGGRFTIARSIAQRLLSGRLRLDEVEREWSAQIEWLLASGLRPSHLDSHCQTHALPALYRLTIQLASRYGIPGVRPACGGLIYQLPGISLLRVRLRPAWPPEWRSDRVRGRQTTRRILQPDHFSVLTALGQQRTSRQLQALLHALPPGTTELVTHPGHVDDQLRRIDPLTEPREREWLILSRPSFQAMLARENIRLISWAELPAHPGSYQGVASASSSPS